MDSGILVVHIEIKYSVNLFGYIWKVMFYVKCKRIPEYFITVERSFGCQREKNLKDAETFVHSDIR